MTKTSREIKEKVKRVVEEFREEQEKDAALRRWAKEIVKELAK